MSRWISLPTAVGALLSGLVHVLLPGPAAIHAQSAKVSLDYYLPANTAYNPAVPRPSSYLGFEVGEWHVRHDQIVEYLYALERASDRVLIEEIGRTHERRPLIQLMISSPENIMRRSSLLAERAGIRATNANAPRPNWDTSPVVVQLAYSIHGNESSGANAALLTAYHLAAAESDAVERVLRQTVIILDPAMNPDGLSRFALWANSHRGTQLVADANHREHVEAWPGGRGNHYWFDLNRDWLLLRHPESRARLDRFHRWLPNVLADFHEMGSDATYFFQPGVPARRHPLTPEENVRLTETLAAFHARKLDGIQSLYFTQERFDDFYYGKGSTYPDAHGSIGILFEQASSRGHLRESENGPLSFPFTIRNQFLTSLSTIEGAASQRRELLRYQAEFFQNALAEGNRDSVQAYLVGDELDPGKTELLLDLLRRHRIRIFELAQSQTIGGTQFSVGSAYLIPVAQPQYRLIKSLFERRTEFPDNIFYDVSTWTLPLAFNVPYAELSEFGESLLGPEVLNPRSPTGRLDNGLDTYAFAFQWHDHWAPRALNRLLKKGIRAKVSQRPFRALTRTGATSFDYGAIVIPLGIQDVPAQTVSETLFEVAMNNGIHVHAITSGLTPSGIDLGSSLLRTLRQPKPLLVVGSGVSAYEAGEVWHLLDHQFEMELTLVEADRVDRIPLKDYTHIILVSGAGSQLSAVGKDRVQTWVQAGGAILAQKSSVAWLAGQKLVDVQLRKEKPEPTPKSSNADADKPVERRPYADYSSVEDAKRLAGAIFVTELDRSHPIAYGYTRSILPVFKNDKTMLEPGDNPYGIVALHPKETLAAGYVHEEDLPRVGNTAAVLAQRVGQGTAVLFADNPNFRAYWLAGTKLFLNGLFFSHTIERTLE